VYTVAGTYITVGSVTDQVTGVIDGDRNTCTVIDSVPVKKAVTRPRHAAILARRDFHDTWPTTFVIFDPLGGDGLLSATTSRTTPARGFRGRTRSPSRSVRAFANGNRAI